ncbi:hypothetical protein EGW08_009529 [Elysia chlorotica]|uniref:Uncharacterized protein n=1 Tax=Elysia chlorotica TaxID=188477 RepID=A0A3S0ZPG1_ELYCH|nr:hypothetical protein EGW08_009529 [Elysia chlorotica]
MLHNNQVPIHQNYFPLRSRPNDYPPNLLTPPPNGYFDCNRNPFSMVEPPKSSKDLMSADFQSKCQIDMNKIEQQDSFHSKPLNVQNEQQLKTQTDTFATFTSSTIPQHLPDAQCQKATDEANWNLQNQNIETTSESINRWILDCGSGSPDEDTEQCNREYGNGSRFDQSQSVVSFQDFLNPTEEDVKEKNCTEEQYEYNSDQEYAFKEDAVNGVLSSEESETISTHYGDNAEELCSETAGTCTSENNDNIEAETEEEPKKYSKSYWRKQRRLRLKERLMAEKLNVEAGLENKKSDEETETTKANKAVKSAGKGLEDHIKVLRFVENGLGSNTTPSILMDFSRLRAEVPEVLDQEHEQEEEEGVVAMQAEDKQEWEQAEKQEEEQD